MDEAALHVENLREALRQTQRHIVTAIGASASLLLGARHRQCQRGRDDDSSTWCWRSSIRDRDLSLGDLLALGIGYQFETLALRIKESQAPGGYSRVSSLDNISRSLGQVSVRRFRR
jgi:hypothetical protein